MDQDNDGRVSLEEFYEYLRDEKVSAYFKFLNIDTTDTHMLFHLMDFDNDKYIDIDEFLKGCYDLQKEQTNMDAMIIRRQLQWLVDQFVRMKWPI